VFANPTPRTEVIEGLLFLLLLLLLLLLLIIIIIIIIIKTFVTSLLPLKNEHKRYILCYGKIDRNR